MANNILWFTFVKACWRAVGAACGKTITFKTTIKGANALMNSAIGDLWMPVLVLGGGLASFGETPSASCQPKTPFGQMLRPYVEQTCCPSGHPGNTNFPQDWETCNLDRLVAIRDLPTHF